MSEHADGERPLGAPTDFTGARRPEREALVGAHVTLRPLESGDDAAPLYRISHAPSGDPGIWTYLPYGPHPDVDAYRSWLEAAAGSVDELFFTVVVDGVAAGIVAWLAIEPAHGTIEIGHVWFGPDLARTVAATEAIFLLARHAFDTLGYRRLEWKCNALNAASRRAAERFGFRYEGTFVQHRVIKGRNRDTAWFAITDVRWPQVRAAFAAWLAPENFDGDGRQRQSLAALQQTEDTSRGERHHA